MADAEYVGPLVQARGIPWCRSFPSQRCELIHDWVRSEDRRWPFGVVVISLHMERHKFIRLKVLSLTASWCSVQCEAAEVRNWGGFAE